MRALYFAPVVSIFLFFSSPILSGRKVDVYHTCTHDVALKWEFRMRLWNVLHAACWKYRTQKWRKNRHLRTIAQLCWYIFVRHIMHNRKNLLNSNISFIQAKFHYASWFEAGSSWNLAYHLACYSSELARTSRFAAKLHYAIWFEAGSKLVADQLRTR